MPIRRLLQLLTRRPKQSPAPRTLRRRHAARRLAAGESLEDRILLSAVPALVSLELENDTGTPGDNVTTEAVLTGSASNDGSLDGLLIELDYDGDGVYEQSTATDAAGNFSYDVGSELGYGQQTVKVRVGEWDVETSAYQFSDWDSISYTHQAPTPVLSDVAVDASGILTGTVSVDGEVANLSVELDYDGDGLYEQTVGVDGQGHFSYDVGSALGAGEQTVSLRAAGTDTSTSTAVYSDWDGVTFTNGPVLGVTDLAIDSSGILTGRVTNDGSVSYLLVELDYDGDGVYDASTYTDAYGDFSYDVGSDLGSGEQTIGVRVGYWDMSTYTYAFSGWETIQYSTNVAPVITEFTATESFADVWTFEGYVVDEDVDSLTIVFGGLLAGITVEVGELGWFSFDYEFDPGTQGTVTAQTTDAGGLESNTMIANLA